MTVSAKRSRKKMQPVQVEHKVYGPCEVVETKFTDSGQVLTVRFPDGGTRSLLAAPHFWVALPDLAGIPVEEPLLDEDEPTERS
jgi:hypothetical protein